MYLGKFLCFEGRRGRKSVENQLLQQPFLLLNQLVVLKILDRVVIDQVDSS